MTAGFNCAYHVSTAYTCLPTRRLEILDVSRRWTNAQKNPGFSCARQDELNQLNITVRQVEEYNEQMKAEIQVTRRATYKAEDHIKQIEAVKHKQDLLIDGMNEDVKRLTEAKAGVLERTTPFKGDRSNSLVFSSLPHCFWMYDPCNKVFVVLLPSCVGVARLYEPYSIKAARFLEGASSNQRHYNYI